ncbi:MAG: MBL fold metallo-hydrolase [Thermoplasmata archaeon]|nr:MBL fold metallo-hydrolase [Thermoplasmata archaeon]
MFVSHAHMDHAGHLGLVDPTIPVFVPDSTRRLLDAIESCGSQKYGDHDWRRLEDGKGVKVGGVEVVPLPVDHSIPSAYGFLIHTSEGTVVYTGDFRMHGPRAAATHEFVRRAAEEAPEVLVMEGTRAGPDPRRNFSEEGVRSGIDDILGKTELPALVSCYPRDVDRLTTLYRAARLAERDFVIPLKTAHLLSTIRDDLPRDAPGPGRSEGLKVYHRSKKVYYKWERPFLDDAVDAEYIRHHGRDVLLSLDLPHFAELIDLRPPEGSPFIHSMSEPFSEDDVDDHVLSNWIDHFGLRKQQMHASGHCSGPELHEVTRTISPRGVIPVHTEHADAFAGGGAPVRPPVKGLPMAIRT